MRAADIHLFLERTVIPILEPIFQGPLAELADALTLSHVPPAEAIPSTRFTDGSAALGTTLLRYAAYLRHEGQDMRPVASAWSMAYLSALLPPVCAAATVLQHVFPVAADQTFVTLNDDGAPILFHITSAGMTMPGGATSECYAPLIIHHLAPLFDALSSCARVPKKILWGNAARHLLGIFETAGQLLPQHPLITRDRDHLLHSPVWQAPTAGSSASQPNPLHGRERSVRVQEDGETKTLRLHRQCCLYYLLPELGYCGACPLDPRFRKRRGDDADVADVATPDEGSTA